MCVKHSAFTIIEILLAMSIIFVVGALSIPSYRYYSIVNDLERSVDQVTHGLHRARLLSELNEQDSVWGYHVASGIVFKGKIYADRDAGFDEMQPLPATITSSGLPEVSFAILTGEPSSTGSIILTAVNGMQRTITVQSGPVLIAGEEAEDSDFLTICHYSGGGEPHTIKIPESAWPAHQRNHGDTLGVCPEDEDDD
ncbi:MAG: Uncharacterized protein Greene041662_524 [Candidatus Peregrinibacteria bacterium Greene0416_62]|nr:MAG: Uncharacterized protein Greene041662_524 [Candidatus Peregrinibacteria bacterium Greene0416_62]TSC97554.1 MAG: Uncharacterized protein Greene101449_1173 [Candidatus Peregrinibacteria bacterium Greene1014_49]